MFRNIYLAVTIIALLFLTGCVTTPGFFYVNNNRFDSPEVLGKPSQFEVMGSYQSETAIIVDADVSLDPPGSGGAFIGGEPDILINTFESISGVGFIDRMYLDLRFSLGERFDIGADFSAGELPSHIKLKYQFMGETQLNAKKDNVSGAVVLGFLYGSREIDNETDILGNNYNGELSYYGLSASVVLGRRIHDRVLLYFNQSVSFYLSDLDLDRDIGGVDSKYSYASDGHQLLSLFGTKIFFNESQSFFIGAEAGAVSIDWDNAKSDSEFTFGLMSGVAF